MSDDVTIVIKANDQASRILKELADTSKKTFVDMENSATKSFQSSEMSLVGLGVAGAVAGVAATAAASVMQAAFSTIEGSIDGLMDSISRSLAEYDRQKEAANELAAVLDGAVDSYVELAAQLEKATNIDSSKILGLMKDAKLEGASENALGEMAQSAIGLSEIFGGSLAEGFNLSRAAATGSFSAFEALIPGITLLATEEEKLAAVSRLASEGLKAKADAAGSAEGAIDRINTTMTNMEESVGAALAPLRDMAYNALAAIVETIATVNPAIEGAGTLFQTFSETVQGAFDFVVESSIYAGAVIETIFENMGLAVSIGTTTALLFIEQLRADFMHVLTVAIPAYATWFYENMLNIFVDLSVGSATILGNYFQNLQDQYKAVFEWIATGFIDGNGTLFGKIQEIASRSLLEGFEATSSALPEIQERQLTDLEKSLTASLDHDMGDFMAEVDRKFEERMKAEVDAKTMKVDTEVELEAIQKVEGTKKLQVNSESLNATESRILVRGPSEGPLQALVEKSQQQIDKLEAIRQAIFDNAANRPDQAPAGPNLVFVT